MQITTRGPGGLNFSVLDFRQLAEVVQLCGRPEDSRLRFVSRCPGAAGAGLGHIFKWGQVYRHQCVPFQLTALLVVAVLYEE